MNGLFMASIKNISNLHVSVPLLTGNLWITPLKEPLMQKAFACHVAIMTDY